MGKKLTNEEFLQRAIQVHGNKYTYNDISIRDQNNRISIHCPIHGVFHQTIDNHLKGQNCPYCSHRSYKKSIQEFIGEARKIHMDKYDYSEVNYVNNKTKGAIFCPKHGYFQQLPTDHLRGHGCPKCNTPKGNTHRKPLMSQDEFIKKAKIIHNNKYDYSLVCYQGSAVKVTIICPIHGEFTQKPNNHLNGQGCPKCANLKPRIHPKKYTKESFIQKAKEVHNCKYDYFKVEYVNTNTNISIICPIHGEFKQTPHNHLHGQGCSKCALEYKRTSQQKSKELFIEECQRIHKNTYDYSQVEYINNKTKVCIICPKHGKFWQRPSDHLNGKGCPYCKTSKLEEFVSVEIGKNYNIERQKRFDWLGNQSLDIYIPEYNVAVECQGEQHFEPIDFANKGEKWSTENLKHIQELDATKKLLCEEHNIKLLYFGKKKYNEEIITNTEVLLEKIKESLCTILNKCPLNTLKALWTNQEYIL